MKRRTLIKNLATVIPALYLAKAEAATRFLNATKAPFNPTWESLKHYQTPEWFRDAKFGIWAHWGPQCQPEHGDWYARIMYQEGSDDYDFHIKKYGHPSKFGFKDVINEFKAENWDPEELVSLYKKAGARYFFALANHHDNFDMYNSKYQNWNSVNMGPKKDVIKGWAKAAKNNGLPFGVSVHAAHAWQFYEPSQLADTKGPLKGVPYDGKTPKEDGAGKWWAGYDPQQLYVQNHALSVKPEHEGASQWEWGNGANVPTPEYCQKFYNRTIDLIDNYEPDLLYFDDTVLPLYPISDVGLKIAAQYYNSNIKKNSGKLEAVMTGKILNEEQRKCMVWDIERGQSNTIEPLPWQTDTCIGNWHYDRRVYENHGYKTAQTVIQILADVVSKNGNLLLNIPVRGDGTIDDQERAIVEEIGAWMAINQEGIFGTRPWKVFGEGPATENAAKLSGPGFNEGKNKPYVAQDIRFTTKGKILYAISFGWPDNGTLVVKSLNGNHSDLLSISRIELLGSGEVKYQQTTEALEISVPPVKPAYPYANVFKIT
jgi:alpha-L-fucosidase